ncbi:cupin domain-containing protein [Sphingosinicella sp. BN140058]|uniref:cupin domain-containing protein n=1 Tax=Sphingosinicella sp. BN140058 TaxID=1892855 RepID=UPI0010130F05|nr:cupin domain-containing protein [Sphingosinicella sp. BN140058]QAY76274.1 cupin domain-containing protein [Sphingosinicella sp. BN140058]
MEHSPNQISAVLEDEKGWVEITPGERFAIRTSAVETAGRYTIIEIVADPRNAVPLHIHGNEEEHFLVVEGRVHLTNGEQKVELSAGEAATVKKGTPHAWANLSDAPVRMLVVFTPGDQEKAFRLIETVRDGDFSALIEENERLGTSIVGPPPYDDVYSVFSPRLAINPTSGSAAEA